MTLTPTWCRFSLLIKSNGINATHETVERLNFACVDPTNQYKRLHQGAWQAAELRSHMLGNNAGVDAVRIALLDQNGDRIQSVAIETNNGAGWYPGDNFGLIPPQTAPAAADLKSVGIPTKRQWSDGLLSRAPLKFHPLFMGRDETIQASTEWNMISAWWDKAFLKYRNFLLGKYPIFPFPLIDLTKTAPPAVDANLTFTGPVWTVIGKSVDPTLGQLILTVRGNAVALFGKRINVFRKKGRLGSNPGRQPGILRTRGVRRCTNAVYDGVSNTTQIWLQCSTKIDLPVCDSLYVGGLALNVRTLVDVNYQARGVAVRPA